MTAPRPDHETMRLIRARINVGYPMTGIARELGIDIDELCDFIMKYREPKKHKPYINRQSGPLGPPAPRAGNGWSLPAQGRRQIAWLKARDGARAALAAIEAERDR